MQKSLDAATTHQSHFTQQHPHVSSYVAEKEANKKRNPNTKLGTFSAAMGEERGRVPSKGEGR